MANETEIDLNGRYLTLKNTTTDSVYFTEFVDQLKYLRNGDEFVFYPSAVMTNNIQVINQSKLGTRNTFDYNDTLNPATGVKFVDGDTMEAWIIANVGFFDNPNATPINVELTGSGVKSTDNSSTSLLGIGATFTGTAELNDYADVMVSVKTDQNGTLYMDFSPDGTNWDSTLTFFYDTARINAPHVLVKGSRYYRTRFENTSGIAQTYLRLQTDFGSFNSLTSPINGTLSENFDATVVRPTNYHYEVAEGRRQGSTTVNKFGYNADIDSASGFEIIASFGGTFSIMTTADTLDVVSDDISDTSAGAGAQQILISGIDSNYLAQEEYVTMNAATPVTTVNTWLGVNRVVVIASGANQANVGVITISDTSGTVGTQARILEDQSVTQQCIYHTQINHNLLLDWLYASVLKISGGGGSPRVQIKGFSYSRVTDTFYEIFRTSIDTAVENHFELSPSQPFILGGREVLYFVADTDTNNTEVTMRFSGIEERIN